MPGRTVDPELLRRWREAENLFFAFSMAEPEFYHAAVTAAHGLAVGLADVGTEEELGAAYEERDLDWAEERVAAMEIAGGEWVDVAAARDAAFSLRLQDLRSSAISTATAERLGAARAAGETWLVTADGFVAFGGQRQYRRVEIHTRAGVAIFCSSSRDWERGVVWWLEVLPVDPETGAPTRGAKPLEAMRTFSDRDALEKAFAEARAKYQERFEKSLATASRHPGAGA